MGEFLTELLQPRLFTETETESANAMGKYVTPRADSN